MMKKIYSILKLKKVYIPIIILVLGGAAWVSVAHKGNSNYQTAKVAKEDFYQEVSVTGTVTAANDVQLGFETGGRVDKVLVNIGDKVKAGQELAYVDPGDLSATLLSKQAALESAQANLQQAEDGTRPEDIAISQTAFTQAQNALQSSIIDAYVKSDDAIHNKTDAFFVNPRSTSATPQIFTFNGPSSDTTGAAYDLRIKINAERGALEKTLTSWSASISTLEDGTYNDSYLTEAKANLDQVRDFLNDVATAVALFQPDSQMSSADIQNFQNNVSVARSNINAAIDSINAAEQSYTSAQAELNLKNAGSTSDDIAIQEAAVKSAQAGVLQVEADLAKTTIVAPFDGTITKTNLTEGEIVNANDPTTGISMISNDNFEIDSYIPEADISKIAIGEKGNVTLDAYSGGVNFGVVVTSIDQGSTQVDGVATYKTVLQFTSADDRIKSGMTANIDIDSPTRPGVIVVPQSAVITKNGAKTVLVMKSDNTTETRTIQTGLIDATGNIEVTSGLSEGETIVTNPPRT